MVRCIMKRYKKEIHLSSFDNLTVSLYLIGYKNIGESIVVLFKDVAGDENKVVFSFVIDCYKKEGLFLTKKILEDNGVTALDMVCWTHPHCDHTPGIDEIVNDYFKPDMWFFMPKFYFGNLNPDLLKTESAFTQEANMSLENILKKKDKESNVRKTIIGNGDITTHFPVKMVTDDGRCRDLDFYFLTPCGRLIDKYVLKGNEINRPNDLSISFIMSLDGYDFFFGGDTENDHAGDIEKELIKNMRWIKVPHHCSKGAEVICDNIGPYFDFAASTVYTSSGLPDEDIQKKYIKNGRRLFMTQLKNMALEQEYGVVQFNYSFCDDQILVDIHTFGNAHEYISSNS